jgi:tetratricopeptide (TPR) repeat protein
MFTDSRFQIVLCCALVVVITSIAFSSVLDNELTNWDERVYFDNHIIKELSWENTKVIFASFHKEFFSQPMVLLSFSLEYRFFQEAPFIYHLTNLTLHILNSLLVFFLIYLFSNRVLVALVAALLFGVHPLHVESVAWVAERKDMLSTFFFLSSLLSYVFYRRRAAAGWYCLSIVLFILALFSKPIVVTLPLVMFLCDYLEGRRFDRAAVLEKLPFFALSAIFGIITISIHKATTTPVSMSVTFIIERALIACYSIVFYLKKTIAPANLSAIYSYPEEITILSPAFFVPPFLIMAMAAMVIYTRRHTRGIVFGGLFFIITILPTLQIVPFPTSETIVADRYTYIPSIGLFFLAGLALHELYFSEGPFEVLRKVSLVIVLGVLVSILVVITYQRNDVWQDSETLWTDTIKKSRQQAIAHNNLGLVYRKKGLTDKAIEEFKEAIRLKPYFAEAHNNLGLAYSSLGRTEESIEELILALTIKPDLAGAHNNLGNAYSNMGRTSEAIEEYKVAIRLNPDFAEAHYNLGNVLSDAGSLNEAERHYRQALSYRSDFAKAHNNLGLLLVQLGRPDEAIEHYRLALTLKTPYHAEIHTNLGITLAQLGRFDEAIEHYRKALRLKPDYDKARKNLEIAISLKKGTGSGGNPDRKTQYP